jgi:hypothetical protein
MIFGGLGFQAGLAVRRPDLAHELPDFRTAVELWPARSSEVVDCALYLH